MAPGGRGGTPLTDNFRDSGYWPLPYMHRSCICVTELYWKNGWEMFTFRKKSFLWRILSHLKDQGASAVPAALSFFPSLFFISWPKGVTAECFHNVFEKHLSTQHRVANAILKKTEFLSFSNSPTWNLCSLWPRVRKTLSACQHCCPESFCENP